ncbi:MAG: ABC transporter permease, partial [Christensenellaceae bacterium]|nr:ABC transporter permease [Christensenellaceae bacterium]
YAIMALGVMITYKILDFPDLTVDSSFPLGAAVCTVAIINNIDPILSLVLAFVAGAIAGFVTGIIHVKLKVRDLLSGIITMTGLYSINYTLVGKSNMPIFTSNTIFKNDFIKNLPKELSPYSALIIIVIIVLVSKLALDFYLSTKAGFLLKAVGDNPIVISSLAQDKGKVKIIGLTIANAFVSLAGGVMGQHQRFFEISMGTGAIVIGLASVIIGSTFLAGFSFFKLTSAVIVGSVIYKACVAIAIELGVHPSLMKLITAILFLIILVLGKSFGGKKVKVNA